MAKTDKIIDRITLKLNFELERWFHLLLFYGLLLSAMISLLLSIDAWGLLYASLITFSATICAVVFWKVQSHFRRSFRSSLLLILLLFLAYPLWVLVGSFTPQALGMPVYLLIVPIAVGVFALISGSLFAWKSFMRVNFVAINDLSTEDIVKVLFNLPERLQTNQNVLDAFASMARVSWLFANNEFNLVINVIGSSIEKLLGEIYPEEEVEVAKKAGVAKKAKKLGLDVSYEKLGFKGKNSFSVSYFWHNVRGKYAHSTGIETVGSKQSVIFNVLKEPSEETTKMSIGLLNVFLKAYSEYCTKLSTEESKSFCQ